MKSILEISSFLTRVLENKDILRFWNDTDFAKAKKIPSMSNCFLEVLFWVSVENRSSGVVYIEVDVFKNIGSCGKIASTQDL